MDRDQMIYWFVFAVTFVALCLGIWLGFLSGKFWEHRAKLAERRLGKKVVGFFIVTLRVLGILLVILSTYLLGALIRIMPCALK